ncbi:uncharacterized protein TNCV_3366451 [Trichonephila clavipes]|nr:uncharacterized protein TNCV_3366451 [Trichonephila clavipes]
MPLKLLQPLISVPKSTTVYTVSISSSSTQAYLLPSASSIKPTIQIESWLPKSISTFAATPDNSLTTLASSLSTETCPVATTFNKFATLSPEVQTLVPLPESAATTSNSEPFNAFKIPQSVKQNSKIRRKCTKVQKPEIEIKMAKHKPRKSAPTEYTTDDEDMIMYDVEEKLEPNPADKFAMKLYYRNNPDKYMRMLTPTRFR